MAVKGLFFFLSAVAIFTMNEAALANRADGEIYEEKDIVLRDGTVVHEKKTIDANCHHETDIATFPDHSTSTVMNEYDDGKGLILFSSASDVCYVRDLSEDEKKAVATCDEGTVERKEGAPDEVEMRYVEAGEMNNQELPPSLREQCQGRKIVRVVEASAERELEADLRTGEAAWPRAKRWCSGGLKCVWKFECRRTCSWFRCVTKCGMYVSCRLSFACGKK